jgi:hypothetical protein
MAPGLKKKTWRGYKTIAITLAETRLGVNSHSRGARADHSGFDPSRARLLRVPYAPRRNPVPFDQSMLRSYTCHFTGKATPVVQWGLRRGSERCSVAASAIHDLA